MLNQVLSDPDLLSHCQPEKIQAAWDSPAGLEWAGVTLRELPFGDPMREQVRDIVHKATKAISISTMATQLQRNIMEQDYVVAS